MKVLIPLAALLLAACASTNEPGWTGTGAEPFDTAHASCQAQSPDAAAFTACMAEKGWTRPN